ncbi:hypothetical protein [Paraburkholderia sp. BL25I1N1]|uniref:hypothetical protein n=1 Tax=Paraburkholderia sp. BL25I1N1 TaxID=1938804 RepID=UPI0015E61FAB|nr:hypothetical protein [Paraburkholderia sp. BL25I1N1]
MNRFVAASDPQARRVHLSAPTCSHAKYIIFAHEVTVFVIDKADQRERRCGTQVRPAFGKHREFDREPSGFRYAALHAFCKLSEKRDTRRESQ